MSLLSKIICAYDLNGNANRSAGTNNGTASNTTWVTGKIGQAASFDGTSTSNILISDNSDFTFGSADFSVSCWVKKTTNGTRQIFIGQSDPGGGTPSVSFIIEFQTTNAVRGIVGFNGGSASTPASTATITDTNWHHIVLLRDSGTMRLYIDGVADGTSAISGTVNNSINNFALGRAGDLASLGFPGSMDMVYLFTGKLDLTEISQLYNGGNGLAYPFSTGMMQFFLQP